SAAVPVRPNGEAAAARSRSSAGASSKLPGLVGPGRTLLTVMPRGPSSLAQTSVNVFRAALPPAYRLAPAIANSVVLDEMFTIRPPGPSRLAAPCPANH